MTTIPRRPQADRKQPVIGDVALLAGVSYQTVSRVVNNSPHVRPETRSRVEAAIAALGWVPDPAARALASRRHDGDVRHP